MSLFALPIGPSAPSHGVTGMFYNKTEPNQPLRSDQGFGSQRISFQLNPATNQWWLPSRSYFRIRVSLAVRNAADDDYVSISSADKAYDLYPAYGMGSRLFNQVAFQIGSTTVCSVANNLPQVDALHKRTTLSRAQLEQSDGLYQANKEERRNQFTREVDTTQSYELIFQPPLGISDVQHAMPASNYMFTFVANPNFLRDVVDGDGVERTPDLPPTPSTNGYVFRVESMVYYAAMVQGPDSADQKFSLNMRQISCQALNMSQASNALQLRNFDTSSDTTALAIAFQNSAEGNADGGKGLFVITNGDQKNLTRWYVSFDSSVYPQEQNEDFITAQQSYITQRWRDTHSQTGLIFSPGGAEYLESWLDESGPYYYMNWPRVQSSATRVQVNAELNSATPFDVLLLSVVDSSFLVRSQDGKVKKVELAE